MSDLDTIIRTYLRPLGGGWWVYDFGEKPMADPITPEKVERMRDRATRGHSKKADLISDLRKLADDWHRLHALAGASLDRAEQQIASGEVKTHAEVKQTAADRERLAQIRERLEEVGKLVPDWAKGQLWADIAWLLGKVEGKPCNT